MNTCKQCGAEFTPSRYHPNQKFCTTACRNKWGNTRAYSGEAICKYCGKTFRPKRKERNQYCSRECAYEHKRELACREIAPIWISVCPICGKHTDQSGHYCSNECRMESARRKGREREKDNYVVPTYTCKECGKEFSPEYGNKRRTFCSNECTKKSKRNEPGRKTLNQRARKMLQKIYDDWKEHYQPINKRRVFRRDGYRCQLCGCKVKRTATYHPRQATIDHIIPLSLGGEHKYENVQTCCQECNIRKGATVVGQQRFGWA